ncbi:MAG: APC family permease [Synergistaceae bacterium]|nr:APC family permease [Synergistaceae bacterium]
MLTKRLARRLTTFDVWSFALGGIVGWGSMVMPGTTFLKRGGTLGTMIAMEIAALIMLIFSYNYAFMIKKFPESGGQFIFAEKAFGRTHGFICAWFLGLCYIMIIPMNATALCLVFRALSERSIFHFGFHYTVAGYDIYSGEVILALSALFFFAYMSSRGVKTAGRLQSLFVILLLAGVIIIMAASFLSPNAERANLQPMFFPDVLEHRNAFVQVISILVLAPWMYVGFDTVPQMAEESSFPTSRSKFIMDTSIICGCFVYVAMTLIAASGIPSGYKDWVSYVNDLPNLTGPSGIATFAAAYNILGDAGIFVISVTALMAMLTGILGFYTATSRLLYSLSRDGLLPSWFGGLNKNAVPFNAILFCALVSLPAPFVGRNALGWTVDMSSIGGAISFGYTSLAAVHFARLEKRIDIIIFGVTGFIFSLIFTFFLLVPTGLECSLEIPSYILLLVWTIAGILLCVKQKHLTA